MRYNAEREIPARDSTIVLELVQVLQPGVADQRFLETLHLYREEALAKHQEVIGTFPQA